MSREKKFDDLIYRINNEFKPLFEQAKNLESMAESELYDLDDEISKPVLEVFNDTLESLHEKFVNFLNQLLSIAGEVKGFSKLGRWSFDKLDHIDDLFRDLRSRIEELTGLLKENISSVDNSGVNVLLKEMIYTTNNQISEIRKFFGEELFNILNNIKEELIKMESYYNIE